MHLEIVPNDSFNSSFTCSILYSVRMGLNIQIQYFESRYIVSVRARQSEVNTNFYWISSSGNKAMTRWHGFLQRETFGTLGVSRLTR